MTKKDSLESLRNTYCGNKKSIKKPNTIKKQNVNKKENIDDLLQFKFNSSSTIRMAECNCNKYKQALEKFESLQQFKYIGSKSIFSKIGSELPEPINIDTDVLYNNIKEIRKVIDPGTREYGYFDFCNTNIYYFISGYCICCTKKVKRYQLRGVVSCCHTIICPWCGIDSVVDDRFFDITIDKSNGDVNGIIVKSRDDLVKIWHEQGFGKRTINL